MEKNLKNEEQKINADIAAADTLLNEAKSKLEQVQRSEEINKQELKVSYMMIDAAKQRCSSAMGKLS